MKDFNYYLNVVGEIGYVEQTTSAIIYVNGLPNAKPSELVIFENDMLGQVLTLTRDLIEILVFYEDLPKPGMRVVRTNESLRLPVGSSLLGSIINPLGNSLESPKPKTTLQKFSLINKPPTGILSRKSIKKQLETGVAIVDLITPLGFGQRELVIGDRKTGKTSFLLQSVLAQAKQGNICIYAAVGKRKLDIKALSDFANANKIMGKIVIVASSSEDPAGMIFLTPYSAMTISEYFRDEGNDVFLILDDLSTHAKFYREISLLARRFPGRSSYPGDIFYTHAALLERAGNFATEKGEKAITCLPVAETIQGDLSGYIQTNLMSMTDGHLYFDSDIFIKGRRPAVNPFLSVTRVGRQTQSNLKREINREILSLLTLYEKLLNFSHFGAELSESTKATLNMGEAVSKFFMQQPSYIMPLNVQIVLFCLLWNNLLSSNAKDTTFEKQQDIGKIIRLYNANKDFRKQIDDLIEKATSFNELLGAIKKKGNQLLLINIINKYDK